MAVENRTPVTVIGLGLMGQALAGAFLKAGHPTTVWNRSAEKASDLVSEGAVLASSAGDAVKASGLVVLCVTDYDVVHTLLDPLGAELSGKTLVNLTSGHSEGARETAEWAAKLGAAYLDGAIMAIPPVIGTEHAVLLYAGSKDAYDANESALKALSPVGTTHLGDDHGLASLYDVALLGIMWGVLNSFLHGAALLGAANVKASTFAPFANNWIGAVTNFVTAYAGQIDAGDYTAHDATIDTHLATMIHLIHESEATGISAELPEFVKALTDRAVAAGQNGLSYAAMIDQFRKPSK
ncbi:MULTISPECIES: NAD(P)-binding domain-containing protein [unclassified Streptomyces]|uniref:NAD(P)-dependent oxidoreductase n=1 Tax=unclassified Streptomyces TaxID=2593676 RepID=UPI00081D87D9|nr:MULTISPECIES: NAD(P)-binding domain-containing protein [unclassified Streptomyces]MYZ39577.1 NAD(P)-binding domain-containing protein [Streptomyces sp. SID4917]SCG04388.1 3-hydroxyisobutyrate dehydrogenase [Streptomyces sp. MnatMP-M17]